MTALRHGAAIAALLCSMAAPSLLAAAEKALKLDGLLEYREGQLLVVEGQRVDVARARFKGRGEARDAASIPLGYELRVKGVRGAGGVVRASELDARPNGQALFEGEILAATDAAEAQYRRVGRFYEETSRGVQTIGKLQEQGPQVERVRRVVDALLPSYLHPDEVRVYVIENKEWNAFAMGNRSIYVFSGLLRDLDDDELAIVLGHELAHATHEHSRRQVKKALWIQLGALGALAAAESIDSSTQRAIAQVVTGVAATAYSSGYGRDLEDQADRVGLRYAYEAGYDIGKGPRLWERFAKKYGEPGKAANFFFGDHSLASARARNLAAEIAWNYPAGAKQVDRRSAVRQPAASEDPGGAAPPAPAPPIQALADDSAAPAADGAQPRVGMSEAEVRELLGAPDDVLAFGTRAQWLYPEGRVIFESGVVQEIRF